MVIIRNLKVVFEALTFTTPFELLIFNLGFIGYLKAPLRLLVMLTCVFVPSAEKMKNLSLAKSRNEPVIDGILKSHTFRKSIVSAHVFLTQNAECPQRYVTGPLFKRFLVIINLPTNNNDDLPH